MFILEEKQDRNGIMKKISEKENCLKLICSPLHFYSHFDEESLFWWFKKITCIKSLKGIGEELYLNISEPISELELIELFAIFRRYHFDLTQLKSLERKKQRSNQKKLRKRILIKLYKK